MSQTTTAKLLSTTDAQVWAQEFNRICAELHKGCELDEGWLIGWFANAIETGRSAGLRSLESVRDEELSQGDKLMQAKLSGFNEGLEEAAKVCEKRALALSENPNNGYVEGDTNAFIWTNLEAGYVAEELDEAAAAIRALQSPARVAEGPAHDLPCWPVPESPAKEQPGEQVAAPQAELLPRSEAPRIASSHRPTDEPAVAAPDVAAMVKRIRECLSEHNRMRIAFMHNLEHDVKPLEYETEHQAFAALAALIEKLGQQPKLKVYQVCAAHKNVTSYTVQASSLSIPSEIVCPICERDGPSPPPPERP